MRQQRTGEEAESAGARVVTRLRALRTAWGQAQSLSLLAGPDIHALESVDGSAKSELRAT